MAAVQLSKEESDSVREEMWKSLGFSSVMTKLKTLTTMHTVEGVPFSPLVTEANLMAIREEFEAKADDVLLATFPKSGTHWMWEIILLIFADGYPEKIDRMKMHTSGFEFLEPPNMIIPSHQIFAKMESPRIIGTHLPWQFLPKQMTKGGKGKIVYLMRNPKDVLASTSRFVYADSKGEKTDRMWKFLLNSFLEGNYAFGYGSWFDHVHTYWNNREQKNVFFTSYEELKLDFRSVARRLSKFLLGHELDDDALARVEEHASVKGMRKSYDDIEKLRPDGKLITKMLGTHSFIQKGVIGTWKDFFTVADNELFDRVIEEKMSDWDFTPIYEG